ncbi:MAG: EamA family transporter [Peptococcaceae bacterium]|nr:EamA family transporter [Peptococcaceae bacterium]
MDTRAYLAYGTVCIVWGSTYLAIRIGVSDLPPALFAGVRFILAGLIMLAFVYFSKHKLPGTARDLRVTAIVGLFLLFGGNGLVVWSEQYMPSGITALIISTTPLFVAILDCLVPGGTLLNFKGWAGLILGFSGVGVLALPGSALEEINPQGLAGILAASFLWAAGSVYSARNPVSGSMLAASALQSLVAGLALTLTGILAGETASFDLTPRGAGAMLYLVFAGSILGYSCFLYILKAMPPAIAMTYSYVNPVVAVVLGWLVLGESVTLRQVLAAFVILAGVMLVQSSRFIPARAPVIARNKEAGS